MLGTAGHRWASLGTFVLILHNHWEPLTMLNPHFVAGEKGLFGGHKSEDIQHYFYEFGIITVICTMFMFLVTNLF